MKKRVLMLDCLGEGAEATFLKIESLACPFCREEALWRNTDLSPVEKGEEKGLSLITYLCEHCGMTFSITLVDPELQGDHNRRNLERFRASPVLD